MWKFIEAVIAVVMIPIIVLNALGGLVGGIWLIAVGEWPIPVGVLIAYFISTYLISFALLLAMPFQALGVYFSNKKYSLLMFISLFLGLLITSAVSIAWVLGTFYWVVSLYEGGLPLWPLLLVGYALATGPFAYMARGESEDSHGTYIAVFTTQVIFIVSTVLYLIDISILIIPVSIFVALLADIYLMFIGVLVHKEESRIAAIREQYGLDKDEERVI